MHFPWGAFSSRQHWYNLCIPICSCSTHVPVASGLISNSNMFFSGQIELCTAMLCSLCFSFLFGGGVAGCHSAFAVQVRMDLLYKRVP